MKSYMYEYDLSITPRDNIYGTIVFLDKQARELPHVHFIEYDFNRDWVKHTSDTPI